MHTLIPVNYQVNGIVIKGKQLGRTLDFNTANIKITKDSIPEGTYALKVIIKEEQFPAMGVSKDGIFESHILEGFNRDIYGEEINLDILFKIRDNIKFDSLEALKKQLELDKEFVVNLDLSKNKEMIFIPVNLFISMLVYFINYSNIMNWFQIVAMLVPVPKQVPVDKIKKGLDVVSVATGHKDSKKEKLEKELEETLEKAHVLKTRLRDLDKMETKKNNYMLSALKVADGVLSALKK